jgi:hypothetical protein
MWRKGRRPDLVLKLCGATLFKVRVKNSALYTWEVLTTDENATLINDQKTQTNDNTKHKNILCE